MPESRIIILREHGFRKFPGDSTLTQLAQQPVRAMIPAGESGLNEVSGKPLVAQQSPPNKLLEARLDQGPLPEALTELLAQLVYRVVA